MSETSHSAALFYMEGRGRGYANARNLTTIRPCYILDLSLCPFGLLRRSPLYGTVLCESKSVVSTTVSSARKVVRVPYFLRVLSTIDHSGTLGHGVRVF